MWWKCRKYSRVKLVKVAKQETNEERLSATNTLPLNFRTNMVSSLVTKFATNLEKSSASGRPGIECERFELHAHDTVNSQNDRDLGRFCWAYMHRRK